MRVCALFIYNYLLHMIPLCCLKIRSVKDATKVCTTSPMSVAVLKPGAKLVRCQYLRNSVNHHCPCFVMNVIVALQRRVSQL